MNITNDWIEQLHIKEQMEVNEVKKALYKEKPKATLVGKVGADNELFGTTLIYKTRVNGGKKVLFHVPKKEAENFEKDMDAQLLIRWLI